MTATSFSTQDRATRYERVAFTFCRMGTTGLIVWLLTPPIFILLVGLVTIVLYGKALTVGVNRSRCFLRRPRLIMGTWAVLTLLDIMWLYFTYFRQ